MMTTTTTRATAARVSGWRTRRGERRAHVVARTTMGENVSEPVKRNGSDVRRGRALESGSDESEEECAPRARTDEKRQSRWSSEFWDELEFDVMEPWMMQEDDTRGDGFLRSESLLSPSWRLMLLSDGSVTRHLKLLTGRVDVTTNVLWQGNIDANEPLSRDAGVIADVSKRLRAIDDVSPLLQREVDLCDASGVPLCYAASWWNLNASRDIVLDADAENGFGALDRPVWLKLAETKTELFREVRRIYRGVSPALATAWDLPSDTTFWARHYIFWYHRRPLCVIHEVMSPRLERYLGPPESAARRPPESRRG